MESGVEREIFGDHRVHADTMRRPRYYSLGKTRSPGFNALLLILILYIYGTKETLLDTADSEKTSEETEDEEKDAKEDL